MAIPGKTIWTLCLCIEINALCANRCGNVDYRLDVEFVYHNQTDKRLVFGHVHPVTMDTTVLFTIEPMNSFSKVVLADTSTKSLDTTNCCQGVLEGIGYPIVVIFEGGRCLVYGKDEGPTLIENYQAQELRNNAFKFDYFITEADRAEAVKCN